MSNKNKGINEHCGIFAISCNDFSYSVPSLIYSGLMALQHRGQIFAGLSVSNCSGTLTTYKDRGMVSKVLTPSVLKNIYGNVGIGHVCYGEGDFLKIEEAQPYHYQSDELEFSISMNGKLTNYIQIKRQLENMGRIITGNTDIELVSMLISSLFTLNGNFLDTLKKAFSIIEGGYCVSILTKPGDLYILRDSCGIKPLCYGKTSRKGKIFQIFASESSALDVIGAELVRDVRPGEIIKIDPVDGMISDKFTDSKHGSLCVFEYIYFARPDSIIEKKSVFDIRYNLGRELAKKDAINFKDAIVVPVPDSGRSAAMGYAWESGSPYQEGLIKNRYVWQLKVEDIKEKLNPITPIVKGKNVILVDDSIISGQTMKRIIKMLKNAGANQIHVRVSAPVITESCQFNQNFSNKDLLIGYKSIAEDQKEVIENIRDHINADSLQFLTVKELVKVIDIKETSLCLRCFQSIIKDHKERLVPTLH
ncbi:MAG: Amidophosphoribosyltransferase [Promethearchaeota archaeon]|jgi:amidophosphoribosyltransferase|nr:MAG: Amidophosphoribosyltransferase [Candidatus Lokiarchaeota archaeon]